MKLPACLPALPGVLVVMLGVGTADDANAQSGVLDSLIRQGVHTFEMRDGRLAGPGAELLRKAAEGAQFVSLGDDHNTKAIPEFTVGLFRLLHEAYGFNYLALEEGPALGELLSLRVRGGEPDAAFKLALEFPNAFHFYNEEYVRMIDRIAAISRAERDPVWGLNQEFGTAHVFSRLVQIAPDDAARDLAADLLRRSLEYEGERFSKNISFILHRLDAGDFEKLRMAFRPAPGSEADRLISQTLLSHEVYTPYGMNPRPHFTAFYESAARREQNMKRLFADRYREAVESGVRTPRVLVKSGHAHTVRGIGRFHESLTLGNFLHETATINGHGDLNLVVHPNRGYFATAYPAFAPHLRPETNTIFDLRPLRPWAAFNRIPGLDPELRRVLVGADMLIVLGDASPGSLEALRTPNFIWYPAENR